MLERINDSKKSYFIWLGVMILLFFGLFIFNRWALTQYSGTISKIDKVISLCVFPYVIAALPLGWTVRRRLMKWYVHVPVEKIKVFETNLVLALFRIIQVEVLAAFNLVLLSFYIVASIIIGVFLTPYFIGSGIIYIVTKKI